MNINWFKKCKNRADTINHINNNGQLVYLKREPVAVANISNDFL